MVAERFSSLFEVRLELILSLYRIQRLQLSRFDLGRGTVVGERSETC